MAVFLPNLLSFTIFGLLLYNIFKELFSGKLCIPFLLTVILLLLPQLRYMARIPSPDMMVLLLMTWFTFAILKRNNEVVRFLILVLIVFTRPDMIIFAGSFLAFQFLYNWIKDKKISIYLIFQGFTILTLYFLIIKINNYPGWHHVFYDTFIQRRNWILGEADFTFTQYKDIMLSNLINFKKISVLAMFFGCYILFCSRELWTRLFALLLIANLYIKFLFFPAAGEYRFFVVFLLLLFIFALKTLIQILRRRNLIV